VRSHRLPQVPSDGGRPDVSLVEASSGAFLTARIQGPQEQSACPRPASIAGAELWPETTERGAVMVLTPWRDCSNSIAPDHGAITRVTVSTSHDARIFLNAGR